MPPKGKPQQQQKKRQRVRMTNKSLESQQFSTVRLPRGNDVAAHKVNVDAMHSAENGGSAASPASSSSAAAAATAFDPIPTDPMFYVVDDSKYWPPPSLEELQRTTGVSVVGVDGFDEYDRRADDLAAKKERTRVVKGELNHPRGKSRKNTIVKLSDSDDDSK